MSASNNELVQKLLNATNARTIAWEPTDITDQFKCSFGSKWIVTVDKGTDENDGTSYHWLTLSNAKGVQLLQVYANELLSVAELFAAAKRHYLRVDEAIADVLKELDKSKSDQPQAERARLIDEITRERDKK